MTAENKKIKTKYEPEREEKVYEEESKLPRNVDYKKFTIQYFDKEFRFNKHTLANAEIIRFAQFCEDHNIPFSVREMATFLYKMYKPVDHQVRLKGKHKLRKRIKKVIKNSGLKLKTIKQEAYKNIVYNVKLQDFDAVSMYASAMYNLGEYLGGFLKGKPKAIQPGASKSVLDGLDGYFLQIKITKIGRHLKFPLITYKDAKGIRQYRNELCEMYVDKTKLEDLVEFQEIEYEIIRGIGFDSGRNPTIGKVMRDLFNMRLFHKGKHDKNGQPLKPEEYRKKNPIEQVYKLLMNALYGKLIMKPIEVQHSFVRGEDKLQNHLRMHRNSVSYFTQIGEDLYMIAKKKGISDHYSMPHCGCEVLSVSKRIINEVMCLAEENDILITYTDTDSMHIDDSKIDLLAAKFEEKYDRKLIGSRMNQFHCDFDFSCDKGAPLPVSVEAFFVGKKSYIDKIEIIRDGKKVYDYHIRLKGIPNKCITPNGISFDVFKDIHDESTPLDLYDKFYQGKAIEFDLLNCSKFKANVNFTTSNLDQFKRRVSFPDMSHLL